MTETTDLVHHLAADARPVRVLHHPLWRATLWGIAAAAVLGVLAMQHGVRPDLAEQWQSPSFRLRLCASLATGLLAALACMLAGLPDRSRRWLLLPLPALALWVSGLGYGCLTDWVSVDSGRMQAGETLRCFATLLLVSLSLSSVLAVMLRHAALLRPRPVLLCAGLAVGGMAASAMSLLHAIDASLMVLIWNIGAAALVVAVDAAVGGRALAWLNRMLAP